MPDYVPLEPFADYEFYTEEYAGTAIPENQFNQLSRRATEIVDSRTFRRASDVMKNDTASRKAWAVRVAACMVAELLYAQGEATRSESVAQGAGGIKSETVGQHRVEYVAPMSAVERVQARQALDGAISEELTSHLWDTGLLYMGVRRA
ncbi:MAG: hypothetical protein LBB86_01570 [Oscillospiraceae bacterium]|jgi:hypothetical protein|nr:hypothetical protein [Oscillospiraceae bacterium]